MRHRALSSLPIHRGRPAQGAKATSYHQFALSPQERSSQTRRGFSGIDRWDRLIKLCDVLGAGGLWTEERRFRRHCNSRRGVDIDMACAFESKQQYDQLCFTTRAAEERSYHKALQPSA